MNCDRIRMDQTEDWNYVMIHNFYDHHVCFKCEKCQITLPHVFMKHHEAANCKDYQGSLLFIG